MTGRAVLWTECQRCGTRVPFSVDEVLRLHREGRELALRCPGCGRRLTVGRDDIPRRLCAWGGTEGGGVMAEKRQIQFERYTNLPLGGNWAGEWPAYVLVHHEGSVDDVRYVPERTCRIVSAKEAGGTGYAPACSSCGWQSGVWHQYNYCPNCGARVEVE